MKKILEIPDLTLELSHGDRVNIYVRKKEILFDFFCDETGNYFTLTKQQLMEMCK